MATPPPAGPADLEALRDLTDRSVCRPGHVALPAVLLLDREPALSEMGHPMAPASGRLETQCLVPGWDAEVLGDLPPVVVDTITSARTPSTRRLLCVEVEPVR